ncbi:ankyrin repeat domain-containing protein [Parachlamydia sp. AcF125]|uniref:ankyrin repeat domain-containing protein n=1 Tax=Parachlamydia sp. AcF125 TaxID=2795736 RepID=UPI001BCA3BA0|nr:ankyrin repeat domain-containing protein [Parachlamydia sp. AcF125]MBS4168111.1 hypothetical protein [Parachlamydia sp. AcF125]
MIGLNVNQSAYTLTGLSGEATNNRTFVSRRAPTLADLARRVFRMHFSDKSASELRNRFFTLIVEVCESEKWNILSQNKNEIFGFLKTADQSVIMHFIRSGKIELVKKIVKNKLFKALIGTEENQVTHTVVREGFRDLLHLLLAEDLAHVNALDERGANLLLSAIEGDQTDLITDCLGYGNNPKQYFSYMGFRLNSLSFAIYKGSTECLDKLIQSLKVLKSSFPIDFSGQIENIGTVLHLAIHADQAHMLEHLLTKYYKFTKKLIETCDQEERTPFILAAYYGKVRMLEALIYAGASLLAEDEKGYNAMHYAVMGKQSEAIKFLHKRGMDVNSIGLRGKTPLMIAKRLYKETRDLEYKKKIKVLLENLSDYQKVNPYNPLDYGDLPPESFVFQSCMSAPPALSSDIMNALENFFKISKNLKRIGGVFHGALAATILAIGEDISKIDIRLADLSIKQLPEKKICDIQKKLGTFTTTHPIRPIWSFLSNLKNVNDGIKLRDQIDQLIGKYTEKTHCTFGELAELVYSQSKNTHTNESFKHLHIMVFEAKDMQVLQINSEEKKWKNLLIADAVVAGIAFPFFISIQNLRKKKNQCVFNSKFFCIGGWGFINPAIQMFDQKKYLFNCFEDPFESDYHFNNRVVGIRINPKNPAEKQLNDFMRGKPLIKGKGKEGKLIDQERVLKIKMGNVYRIEWGCE